MTKYRDELAHFLMGTILLVYVGMYVAGQNA